MELYSRRFIIFNETMSLHADLLIRLVVTIANFVRKRLGLTQFDSAQCSSALALNVDHYVNYGQTDNANERRVLQSTR